MRRACGDVADMSVNLFANFHTTLFLVCVGYKMKITWEDNTHLQYTFSKKKNNFVFIKVTFV